MHHITKKVNEELFGLKFMRSFTTQVLIKWLVELLVMSYLDYCTVAYLDALLGLRTRLQGSENMGLT